MMNFILANLCHKRPQVPARDPYHTHEKEMIKRGLLDAIVYVETEGRGIRNATDEEMARVKDTEERIFAVLGTTKLSLVRQDRQANQTPRSSTEGSLIENRLQIAPPGASNITNPRCFHVQR